MPRVPFIGRLNISEYIALVGSFFLVGLEALLRVLTLALPQSVITLCYRASRRLFNRFLSPAAKRSEAKKDEVSSSVRDASDFVDICAVYGYYAEEHVVQTSDGYLLGLHRLGWKKGEEDVKVNCGNKSVKKRVVYLHHGLLMNSEVWVCLTDEERCLPFALVEKGFDVWFGNNRGNKYSKKSVHYPPTSTRFWDFSMDEFAFHDVPDSIQYILSTTGAPSLSYIGFSQGTAQAFATLAVHPKLNEQVDVFIALAPAMSPAGLSNGIVDALVKASPQVLFLLFGRRSILASATMWQSLLYPPIFVRLIDMGLKFLFGWHAKNISASQKLAAYPHMYSFTSTKSVVHWFQIMRTKSFQMYDDDVQPPLLVGSVSKYTKVAKFPTRNIKTPIVLVYGGSDSLVDIGVMLKALPAHTISTEIKHYEHLDFLWAREVNTLIFPHVFDALESFTTSEHSKEEYAKYRVARSASISIGSQPLSYASEDDKNRLLALAVDEPLPELEPARPSSRSNGTASAIPLPATANKRTKIARPQTADAGNESSSSMGSPIVPSRMSSAGYKGIYGFGADGVDEESRSVGSSSMGSHISFEGKKGKGGHGISLGFGKVVAPDVSKEANAWENVIEENK